jgi:hypothetical protein
MTRSRRGWQIAGAVVTFFVLASVVPPGRARTDRILLLSAAVYAGLLVRARFGVGDRPEAVAPQAVASAELPPAHEQDVRLARLDASLVRATENADQYARVTRPMLRRLATERLRTKHGIDAAADPVRARRLMGEELWEIFATPPEAVGPPPAPDRLHLLVARVERL